MKYEYKKWVLLALFIVVCIEILIINIYLSRISEFRNSVIPAKQKTYKDCHQKLKEIKAYRDKSGGSGTGRKGVPQQGQFKQWAQKAGVSGTPEVRQTQPRPSKGGDETVYTSYINIREVKGAPLFAFLKILEETGNNNRIKELNISELRGKPNTFFLQVTFATYVRSGS